MTTLLGARFTSTSKRLTLSTQPAIACIPLGMRCCHVLPYWQASHLTAPAHLTMKPAPRETATHLLVALTQVPDCCSECSSVAKSQDQLLQVNIMLCAIEHDQCSIPQLLLFQPKKSISGQLFVVHHLHSTALCTQVQLCAQRRRHLKKIQCSHNASRLTVSRGLGDLCC